jgi:DNA-binding NarL/FixJ family response regulator
MLCSVVCPRAAGRRADTPEQQSQEMPPIRVVIAGQRTDERARCRQSFGGVSHIRVVGEAGTLTETMTALKLRPHVLLLDMPLLEEGGTAILPLIQRHSALSRVLLVGDGERSSDVLEAICCGAAGYVERDGVPSLLPKAVRAVAAGQAWIPRHVVGDLVGRLSVLGATSGA